MCAVIGVYTKDLNSHKEILKEIFTQSQIRGKHATGIAYLDEGVMVNISKPIPSKSFIKCIDSIDVIGEFYGIGHCRYSTSDISYNQPIVEDSSAVVHNGVITQKDPNSWEEEFGYNTEGLNDSELILKSSLAGKTPLLEFENSSMSCLELFNSGGKPVIFMYRNEYRPLWYVEFEGAIFSASTSDILKRSFKAVYDLDIVTIKCEVMRQYMITDGKLSSIMLKDGKDLIYTPDGIMNFKKVEKYVRLQNER